MIGKNVSPTKHYTILAAEAKAKSEMNKYQRLTGKKMHCCLTKNFYVLFCMMCFLEL